MLQKLIMAIAGCTLLGAQTPPARSQSDPWQGLQFLVGTWEAKTSGAASGAAAVGTYTFRFELREHVLARHSAGAGCKGPADFNCEHADLLYVYASPESPGQSLKAIYFDNEGHAIHYTVTGAGPDAVMFLSDPSSPGPQFRLTYELRKEIMYGRFEIRAPGQTEFQSYLEWSGPKKPPESKP